MGWTLKKISVANGRYTGLLSGDGDPPSLEALHSGRVLDGLTVEPLKDGSDFQVTVELPAEVMCDEPQVVSIVDAATGESLSAVLIHTADEPSSDLQLEVAYLRSELELLKAAFRRYVREKN